MERKWMFIVPAGIAGIALFTALGGGIVMLLWNWLMPEIFGTKALSFWQALGLLALCRVLVGGRSGPHSRRSHWSQEDRHRFRQRVRERLGLEGPKDEARGSY